MHNMASSGGHLTLASLSAVAAGTRSSFQRRHHNCRNILTLNKLNSPLLHLTRNGHLVFLWLSCLLTWFLWIDTFLLLIYLCTRPHKMKKAHIENIQYKHDIRVHGDLGSAGYIIVP